MYNTMDAAASHIPTRSRAARAAAAVASVCVLLAVIAVAVKRSASGQEHGVELMWGGPLSFDMVHTHILNMKMRRSRLKEKLKQQALIRKDKELAKEHGFNVPSASPAAQQQMAQAPPQQMPQYQMPPQQQQMYAQQPPMYQQPPQYAQQPQPYPYAYQEQQQPGYPPMQQMQQQPGYPPMQQMQQQPGYPPMQEAYGPSPGYPPMQQAAPQMYPEQQMAPPQQLAEAPPQANPWGGETYNAQSYAQAVPVGGPTESSRDDKEQQRSQAAASIQAYEAFMHGGAQPPAKKASPGGAQGMMMHA